MPHPLLPKLKNFFNSIWQRKPLFVFEKITFVFQKINQERKFYYNDISFSLNPFLAAQGIVVCLVFFVAAMTVGNYLYLKTYIQPKLVSNATILQMPAVVGEKVSWSILVRRSDITSGKYLVRLPKNAQNIKVKSVTQAQANRQIALAKQAPQSFIALQAQNSKKGFAFSPSQINLFDVSAEPAANENPNDQTPTPNENANDQAPVIQTPDSQFVDISSEALAPEASAPEDASLSSGNEHNGNGNQSDSGANQTNGTGGQSESRRQDQDQNQPEPSSQGSSSVLPDSSSSNSSSSFSDSQAGSQSQAPEASDGTPPSTSTDVASTSDTADTSDATVVSDIPIDSPADQPSSAQSPDTVQPGDQASEHAPEVTLPDQASNTAESDTDSQAGSGISGSTSSSNVADTTDQTPASELETETETEELVQIDFQTPAIQIAEQDTDQGKQVTVSDPTENPAKPLTNVLAFTTIPEIFRVGQEHKIKIKWKNEGNQEVQFNAYDTDGNGRLDYVEWTVAHLSAQTFDIIFISKAFELDQNLQIINDIYDTVATYDQVYATVPKTHYVRVTFETTLSSQNDITIYAKPGYNSAPGSAAAIAVYPVYTDADGNQTQGSLLVPTSDGANPTFENIDHDGKYRILLSNLESPTDVFDLKIAGSAPAIGIDIDYIVDPTKTWDGGGGGDTNWSTAANWSGDAVPATTDAIVFDGTSSNNSVTVDALGTWSGGTVTIQGSYTGTITQSVSMTTATMTLGAGTWAWTAGAVTLDVNGDFNLLGGTFTAPNASGSFTISG